MNKIKLSEIKKIIKENNSVFIIFSVEWCGECIMTKPILEEIEQEEKSVLFVSLNIDENKLWQEDQNKEFKIQQAPTFIGFSKGKKIFQESNFKTKDQLLELIEKIKIV